ncbi:hypothetical protein [Spirosoma arcticum]
MNEDERQFLLGTKATLESYILLIDDQIIDYQTKDTNEKHDFLIKKRTFTFAVHKTHSEQIQPGLDSPKFCEVVD